MPDRAPAADGVKLMDSVQEAAGATLTPAVQVVLTIVKSALLTVVAPSNNGAVPLLVSETVCAVATLPTVAEANVNAALERVAAGAVTTTAAPVPVNATTLVAGDALWLIVTEPERAPAAVGMKLTLSVQFALGATLIPTEQVLLTTLNSAPVIHVAPSIRATVPVLVSVIVCGDAVAPTVVEAKLRAVLDNEADGAPTTTATPVPAKETVLVAGEAL